MGNKFSMEKGMPLAEVVQNWENMAGTTELSTESAVVLYQEAWPGITWNGSSAE